MKSSEKQVKQSTTETGQIPRELLEAYQEAATQARESADEEDTGSITGVFRMGRRADGTDSAKKDNDTPKTGSASEPARQ
mgnify:FL=1